MNTNLNFLDNIESVPAELADGIYLGTITEIKPVAATSTAATYLNITVRIEHDGATYFKQIRWYRYNELTALSKDGVEYSPQGIVLDRIRRSLNNPKATIKEALLAATTTPVHIQVSTREGSYFPTVEFGNPPAPAQAPVESISFEALEL